MNRRFAQIISDAIDPLNGRIDRARLFAALGTDPLDPIAPIFDAAAFTFDTVEELKATLPDELSRRFRDLLTKFEALQKDNAEQATSASLLANRACDRLERWAMEFAEANRAASQQEITAIKVAAILTLGESGKVARTAQQAIHRSVDEIKLHQVELLSKWEQVRFKAEDTAAALSEISFILILGWMVFAFGAGFLVGRNLF